MSKIIIGYDGSAQAEDAIALGRVLAEGTGARPIVVAAATWPVYLLGPHDLDRAVHAQLDSVLEVAADRLRGLEPQTEAVHSRSVAAELMAAADREDAAAIVIGSSHHGVAGRIALGSVGTSLIHGAPCAITVAPSGLAEQEPQLLKVGVAFDGSEEASSALETGIGIAQRTKARLTVVSIADYGSAYAFSAAWTVYTAAQIKDLEKDEKEKVLEQALKRVPRELPVDGRVLSGSPARVLSDVSSEFDLHIMGSRGYGPVGRTFLGGVATHVIHTSRCPVMVLPRGAGSDPFDFNASDHVVEEPAL